MNDTTNRHGSGARAGVPATTGWGALSGAVVLVLLLGPALAQQTADQHDSASPPSAGADKAETAVRAYDPEDAEPTENWFGCPPVEKGDEDTSGQAVAGQVEQECDPEQVEDAPQQAGETTS